MSTNQNNLSYRNYYMSLALMHAQKNLGNTKDNPSVGCVICKNKSLISIGTTSIKGRPHAEVNAIKLSKTNLRGSDIFISLEPCSHYGKTPPCINLIIKKKINKVFFSIKDPDPRTYNKSIKLLKSKGLHVKHGLIRDKSNIFYRSYLKSKKNKMPFVTFKLAISRDYFIVNKKAKYITNLYSIGRSHMMRYYHDCIISSSKSIITDNSKLTCRINGLSNGSPARIILDRELKIPITANVYKDAYKFNTIVFYNKNSNKINKLRKMKVKLIRADVNDKKNLDLKKILIKLKKLGFSRVLLECGLKMGKSFLDDNLIDDFKLFVAKEKLGKDGKYNASTFIKNITKNKKTFKERVNLLGDELFSYRLK